MFKSSMRAGALAGLVAASVATLAHAALPPTITVNGEKVFPESMTSAADGSVYFGSVGNKMIYRAAPGSDQAEPFVQPGTDGVQSTFAYLRTARPIRSGLLQPVGTPGRAAGHAVRL